MVWPGVNGFGHINREITFIHTGCGYRAAPRGTTTQRTATPQGKAPLHYVERGRRVTVF